MNDTFITFHGWAGSDVRHRVAKDVSVATVRVAATPRLKKDGEWVDGETTWYTVTAWRTLADHLRDSIRKGDPVIVHGRFRTESWQPEEGPTTTTLHVEASLVGHDLTRGITHFIKAPRPDRAVTAEEEGGGDFEDGPAEGRDDLDAAGMGAAHAAA
jgi:single-strand DNA-binding protein